MSECQRWRSEHWRPANASDSASTRSLLLKGTEVPALPRRDPKSRPVGLKPAWSRFSLEFSDDPVVNTILKHRWVSETPVQISPEIAKRHRPIFFEEDEDEEDGIKCCESSKPALAPSRPTQPDAPSDLEPNGQQTLFHTAPTLASSGTANDDFRRTEALEDQTVYPSAGEVISPAPVKPLSFDTTDSLPNPVQDLTYRDSNRFFDRASSLAIPREAPQTPPSVEPDAQSTQFYTAQTSANFDTTQSDLTRTNSVANQTVPRRADTLSSRETTAPLVNRTHPRTSPDQAPSQRPLGHVPSTPDLATTSSDADFATASSTNEFATASSSLQPTVVPPRRKRVRSVHAKARR